MDTKIPYKNQNIPQRQINDTYIIIDVEQEKVMRLNQTASFVYNKIDNKNSISDIANLIKSEYDCDYNTAVKDVKKVLSELKNSNIIQYN